MVDGLSLATGFGCGILACWLLKQGKVGYVMNGVSKAAEQSKFVLSAGHGQAKLILVVRMDLKMGKGKIAAQCSHATLAVYNRALAEDAAAVSEWKRGGQAKVVVKVEDERHLFEVERSARQAGLLTAVIRDAGRTQTAAGTVTVLAVGPAPASLLDTVTGHLKLL